MVQLLVGARVEPQVLVWKEPLATIEAIVSVELALELVSVTVLPDEVKPVTILPKLSDKGLTVAVGGAPVVFRGLQGDACMIQFPPELSGALAVYVPGVGAAASSTMSPSGLVIKSGVNPVPGPDVRVETMLAATMRSLGTVVVIATEEFVPLPDAPLPASIGLLGSAPVIFDNPDIGKCGSWTELYFDGIGPCRGCGDVLGVIDGLGQISG